MAKQRRANGITDAISAITKAVRAEASGTLTQEQKESTINQAMDIVDNSNFVTLGENADDAIELQHQIAEDAAAGQAAEAAAEEAAEQEAEEELVETPEIPEN